ncbi:hypothetical protein C8250_001295 [Streptomyces sp. So13.3]|uniref:NucA/NucB deoxyribonuclease domain-containing protein n=1 Tax=Streptomyces TaxID=1883 RepID=UPI001105F2F2|nr:MULTISPECIES: hypothetical protein [Streptomyces]MCZ4096915.1 hypothetical protein [Streptomyces sp. H39-C1]QNA70760.1 hypothetical protein C8250_001295 [Streptomyces sp. So13.3]
MKHLRRGLSAIAALVFTASLCAAGTAPATAAPPASAAPPGHGTCVATAPGTPLQRQGTAWTCVRTTDTAPAGAAAPTSAALAPAARAQAADPKPNPGLGMCTGTDPRQSSRKAYCVRHWVIYEALGKDGSVADHATVFVAAAASMDSQPQAAWSEDIITEVVEMTEKMPPVTMALSSTCSGQCTSGSSAWDGAAVRFRRLHEGKDGTLSYRSSVGKGFNTTILPTYRVEGAILNGSGPPTHIRPEWNGIEVRCDDDSGSWPGCIVPGHLANVTFSKARYRGAAIAYEWAQKNLTGKYGDHDHPLNRFTDPLDPKNDKRRDKTCGIGGPNKFVGGATGVPNDSCDEYPFAGSWQGGNDGNQCVDITPRAVGGVWDIANVTVDRAAQPTPPYNAPCIRAHVDNKDNGDAGLEYGRAIQSDRIIDSEAFEVIIAP